MTPNMWWKEVVKGDQGIENDLTWYLSREVGSKLFYSPGEIHHTQLAANANVGLVLDRTEINYTRKDFVIFKILHSESIYWIRDSYLKSLS